MQAGKESIKEQIRWVRNEMGNGEYISRLTLIAVMT